MKPMVEVISRGVCLQDGKLLLCQTRGASNTYLPGGHVEFMETARVGLEREIVEELAVSSQAGRFLGMVEHSFMQKGKPHCEWNVVFELSIPELSPSDRPVAADEHITFKWWDLDDLHAAKLEPEVLCELLPEWLRDLFAGERWSSGGDFI